MADCETDTDNGNGLNFPVRFGEPFSKDRLYYCVQSWPKKPYQSGVMSWTPGYRAFKLVDSQSLTEPCPTLTTTEEWTGNENNIKERK